MKLASVAEGEGPALVFVHGRGSNRGTWEAVREAFPGYRRHYVDLIGHGDSPASERDADYAIDAQVGHLAETLADLAEPFVLIGHSLGGFLAVRYALAHPRRLAGLVLEATAADSPYRGGRFAAHAAVIRRQVELAEGEGMAAVCEFLHGRGELHPRQRVNLMAQTPRTYVETIRAIRDMPLVSGRLGELTVPTLVICGLDDEVFLGECRTLTERIPGARGVYLPGCGHSPHRERPAEFLAPLHEHLARWLPARVAARHG